MLKYSNEAVTINMEARIETRPGGGATWTMVGLRNNNLLDIQWSY